MRELTDQEITQVSRGGFPMQRAGTPQDFEQQGASSRTQQHPLLAEIAEYRRERRLSVAASLAVITVLSLALWGAIWFAVAAISAWIKPWM